jgi:hypothetical protein
MPRSTAGQRRRRPQRSGRGTPSRRWCGATALTKQALVEAQDLVRTGQTRVWPAREGSQDGEHTYLYLKSTSDSLALYFDAAAALPTF